MVHGIPWYTTGIPKCKNEIPLVWHTSGRPPCSARYRTVPYRTVRLTLYGTVRSQISFALTGLAARANHLFLCFILLSIPNGVSRTVRDTTVVRITRPSNFFFWFLVGSPPRVRFARALVVFVLYSESFRRHFVIIRLLSFKIHIRYSYELYYKYGTVHN